MLISRRTLLLAVFCLANLFAGSLYSWSVFSEPLAQKLSTSAADLAFIFSVAAGINPFAMISGGWFNDRFGPKYVLTVGGLMIGAGLVLASCAESLLMLSVVYGLCFGFGVGLTYVSTLGTAMKLFPDRKGLAGGLVTMSYGLSSMCVPIAASNLIEHFGITFALLIFGLVCGSVIAATGILSGAATSAGVSHEITKALAALRDRPLAASHLTLPVQDKNWKEMLASPVFYAMLVLFICGSTGALMLIPSAVMISMQQIGLTAQAAAGCVSALAVANTLGRVSGGLISDRIGRLPTLGLSLFAAMSGLMLLLCSGTDDVTTFLAGLILTTVCYGSFVGVFPSLTVETFGLKYNSVNYGIMAAGFSSAGILGPVLLKLFSDASDFSQAYIAAEIVCLAGLGSLWVCRQLKTGAGASAVVPIRPTA